MINISPQGRSAYGHSKKSIRAEKMARKVTVQILFRPCLPYMDRRHIHCVVCRWYQTEPSICSKKNIR